MKRVALGLALLWGAAIAAPEEAAYGRAEGYPAGDRATRFQQRHMVGAFSAMRSLFIIVAQCGRYWVCGFLFAKQDRTNKHSEASGTVQVVGRP